MVYTTKTRNKLQAEKIVLKKIGKEGGNKTNVRQRKGDGR